jgi:alpha-glucosidase
VGEVYILDTAKVASYYGHSDELHLAFNFPPLHAPWRAEAWRVQIEQAESAFTPVGAWPTWVLSNHDTPRHRTRYGSERRARAAAVLLLSLRGTPFLYAGEELGLEDAVVEGPAIRDPGGRDGCRAPVPWTADADHGWGAAQPWLPFPPQSDSLNASSERAETGSMANLYRRLLDLRHRRECLRRGDIGLLATPPEVVGYIRRAGDDSLTVLVNFSDARQEISGFGGTVLLSTARSGDSEDWRGTLGPDEAVIIGR